MTIKELAEKIVESQYSEGLLDASPWVYQDTVKELESILTQWVEELIDETKEVLSDEIIPIDGGDTQQYEDYAMELGVAIDQRLRTQAGITPPQKGG